MIMKKIPSYTITYLWPVYDMHFVLYNSDGWERDLFLILLCSAKQSRFVCPTINKFKSTKFLFELNVIQKSILSLFITLIMLRECNESFFSDGDMVFCSFSWQLAQQYNFFFDWWNACIYWKKSIKNDIVALWSKVEIDSN